MPRVETSVTINAPIEKVFDTIVDPELTAKWSSGISEVSNNKGNPWEKGSSTDMVYHVLGMKFTQHMVTLGINKPNKVIYQMTGGFPGTFEFVLEPQGQATKVETIIDYSVPGGIIGKIANRLLLERMNRKNMEDSTEGLKVYCEAVE